MLFGWPWWPCWLANWPLPNFPQLEQGFSSLVFLTQPVLFKRFVKTYFWFLQLDLPTFSSNLVTVDQQVKIVYVGKTGSLDGMRWGWGLRGRNLDCKPCFLTKPDWKWVITFRFSCFTFYLFILDLGLLFSFKVSICREKTCDDIISRSEFSWMSLMLVESVACVLSVV